MTQQQVNPNADDSVNRERTGDVYYDKGVNGNDELTLHGVGAGVWGLPSDVDRADGASLPPERFDYSAGMFAGVPGQEADAIPGTLHPTVLAKLATAEPVRTYQTIHEATHRRYEAPRQQPVAQSSAGFTLVAAPQMGLHYVKVIALVLMLSGAGTIKLVQGSSDGTSLSDVTGAMSFVGNGGLVLPPAQVETPWFFTAPDQGLGIVTTGSPAAGFVLYCYSPFDS